MLGFSDLAEIPSPVPTSRCFHPFTGSRNCGEDAAMCVYSRPYLPMLLFCRDVSMAPVHHREERGCSPVPAIATWGTERSRWEEGWTVYSPPAGRDALEQPD